MLSCLKSEVQPHRKSRRCSAYSNKNARRINKIDPAFRSTRYAIQNHRRLSAFFGGQFLLRSFPFALHKNNRDADERGYINSISEQVLGAAFEVSNTLGAGFLEKVYHRALMAELRLRGLKCLSQVSFAVSNRGTVVGEYFADILVESVLVVELKCAERLSDEHLAQCLNYIKAFGRSVCLLLNFANPKVEWRRVVREF